MKSKEAGALGIEPEETTTSMQAKGYMVQKKKCEGPGWTPVWIG